MNASAPVFSLRPASAGDRPFLLHLFTQDKIEELQARHWDPALRDQVMAQQFAAQEQYYRSNSPGADAYIAQADGLAVGRLTTGDLGSRLHVMDVALLPEWRGRGLGSWLITRCQAQARGQGVPLSLKCLRQSRALNLYQRLGFAIIGGDAVQAVMEWKPAAPD